MWPSWLAHLGVQASLVVLFARATLLVRRYAFKDHTQLLASSITLRTHFGNTCRPGGIIQYSRARYSSRLISGGYPSEARSVLRPLPWPTRRIFSFWTHEGMSSSKERWRSKTCVLLSPP